MKTRRCRYQLRLRMLLGVCAAAFGLAAAAPVQPAAAATPTLVLYDDELQNMWKDGSWKADLDFKDTEQVYDGACSLKVTLQGKGALCFAFKQGKDLRHQYALIGWISGGEKGGQDIRIAMTDVDGTILPNGHGVRLADKAFLQGGEVAPGAWQQFVVPMSAFNIRYKDITRIIFFNPTDEPMPAFYLDDVGLTTQKVDLFSEENGGEVEVKPVVRDRRTAHIIYADALQNRWEDWSWPGKADMNSADKPFQGQRAIAVTQNGGDGLAFGRNRVFSTKGYQALEFYVRGARRGGQRLDVALYDGNNQEIARVRATDRKYTDGDVSTTTWKHVYIPLVDLKARDVEINKIAIINGGSGSTSYYVDSVCLVK
jgi:hypothetical protein